MLPKTFIVEEEKRLVWFHRAANAGAELIPPKWRRALLLKKIARVESAVAQKLVKGSMEGVGSGPGCRVDHGAVAAELGAVGVGERLKFGNRFYSK